MDIGFVWDEKKYQAISKSTTLNFIKMSTIKDKDETFDYQAYTREHAPDPAKIQRGLEAREQRRKAATPKTVVAIEDDIITEFKQLVPQEQEYRQLINQALREWLASK